MENFCSECSGSIGVDKLSSFRYGHSSRRSDSLVRLLISVLMYWTLIAVVPVAAEADDAGIEWQLIQGSRVEDLIDVAWSDGQFVAVGAHGTTLWSRDGDHWENVIDGDASEIDEADVAWNGERYVRSSGDGIFHSTDRTSWEKANGDWDSWVDFHDVAWGNGRFVAIGWWWVAHRFGGAIAYSADGVHWETLGACCMLKAVAWGNGRFVAVGLGGTIAYSDDGVRWEMSNDSGDGRHNGRSLDDIAWGNDRFVAIGTVGYPLLPIVLHSGDGREWSGSAASCHRSAHCWSELRSVMPRRIFWRDGHFVIRSWIGRSVFLSVDGIDWEEAGNSGGADDPISEDIASIGEHSMRFVTIGRNGTLVYSEDGERWEAVPDTGGLSRMHFLDVASGKGRFVAVRSGGTIVYSSDGLTWEEAESGTSNSLHAVAWGEGRFVAVGENATIVVSPPSQ